MLVVWVGKWGWCSLIHAGDRLHEMDCCLLWISVQLTDFCVTFFTPPMQDDSSGFRLRYLGKKNLPSYKITYALLQSWHIRFMASIVTTNPSIIFDFLFLTIYSGPRSLPGGGVCVTPGSIHCHAVPSTGIQSDRAADSRQSRLLKML